MSRDGADGRRLGGPHAEARWETIARLSAGLAHEVKNPLNALVIHLEVLADKLRRAGDGTIPEHLAKNLQAARAQVGRIDGTVRRFAEYAATQEFVAAELDLVAIVDDVVALCRHEAGRRGVELASRVTEGLRVRASGQALAQALVGLVLGLAEGGVPGGRIDLGATVARGQVELEVGSGLDAPVARAALEGSGASAGTIAAIVRQQGGEAAVEAVSGSGFRVVVRLPLASARSSGAVA